MNYSKAMDKMKGKNDQKKYIFSISTKRKKKIDLPWKNETGAIFPILNLQL